MTPEERADKIVSYNCDHSVNVLRIWAASVCHIRDAVAEEREACARLVEVMKYRTYGNEAAEAAAAIRARSL